MLLDEPEIARRIASYDDQPVGRPDFGLDQAAYVIYTSGSTGRPKGVVVPHEGIGSLVATAVERMGLKSDSKVLQFAAVGFDVAVFELAMALCTGAQLVIAPEDVRVADKVLSDFLDRDQDHARDPAAVATVGDAGECDLPEGMTVLVGTETVPPDLVSAGRTAEPACRLRAHRSHSELDALADSARLDRRGADRHPGPEHPDVRPGRRTAAGAAGGDR